MKKIFASRITHLFLIVIIIIIAYSNTLHVPFQLDDKFVIADNPIIKDLGYFADPSKAKDFSSHFGYHTFKTRYIGYLSFALNYKFNGLNVTGCHILNILIHIGTALLVYFLILLTFKTPFLYTSNIRPYSVHIAVFTALFFACHPLQTEAITYIWQRVASLSAMLYVLSLTAYVRWRLSTYRLQASTPHVYSRIKPLSIYFLSLLSAICAMNTKQIAFTLPVIIALFEFLFFNGIVRKRILSLVPFFLTTAFIPLNLIGTDKPLGSVIGDVGEATRYLTEMSRFDYLFTQFRVMITYIRLIFLPVGQNLDYDYPVYHSLFNSEVFLSFTVLLILFGSGVYLFLRFRHSLPHTRLLSFGIFWFFITLSVESSVIPLIHVINEYRMYLPSIGVFLLICTALFVAVDKLKNRWEIMGKVVVSTLAIFILVLTGATYARNQVWKDELSLWSDVVEKSPNKARGYNEIGMYYYVRKNCNLAIPYFQKAIMLTPHTSKPHNNLGLCYMGSNNIDKAIHEFQQAIKENPLNGMYYINLGIAFQIKGSHNIALREIETGKRLRRAQGKQKINRHFQTS